MILNGAVAIVGESQGTLKTFVDSKGVQYPYLYHESYNLSGNSITGKFNSGSYSECSSLDISKSLLHSLTEVILIVYSYTMTGNADSYYYLTDTKTTNQIIVAKAISSTSYIHIVSNKKVAGDENTKTGYRYLYTGLFVNVNTIGIEVSAATPHVEQLSSTSYRTTFTYTNGTITFNYDVDIYYI